MKYVMSTTHYISYSYVVRILSESYIFLQMLLSRMGAIWAQELVFLGKIVKKKIVTLLLLDNFHKLV